MPKKKLGKNKNTPKTCGLVMPISSIDGCDSDHWVKVKRIITQAIEEGISDPKFKVKLVSDADEVGIIHERIVQNVSNYEIIVCDVSGKNPNVMFELGMRLAFNKPTVIVKDDKTEYSFDTAIIEHIPYPRGLEYTEIETFKTSLANKVRATHEAAMNPAYSPPFSKFFPIDSEKSQISFEYDKDGVLWHGGEKNIALRVVTFLGILEEIAKNIPNDAAKTDVFLETGRKIGCKFGKYFKDQIYRTDLKKLRKDNASFGKLNESERLNLWTEYDSSTGWGLISEHHGRTSSLTITATHPSLFDGIGGDYFSYMMIGYAESVVNEITSKSKKYEYSGNKNIAGDKLTFSLVLSKSIVILQSPMPTIRKID